MPRRADAARFILAPLACLIAFVLLSLCPKASSAGFQQKKTDPQEERKRPVKPELDSKSPQKDPQRDYRIGVNVDLVVIHTTVTDKNGQFVSGLKQENFKVFEDGVSQNLVSFSQEDVPVSLGIVLDTSGSMRYRFESVTKAALAFIRAGNPEDEEFLIGFNDEVELLEDFTSDIDAISDTLNNTVVTGGTALWDAIYLAVEKASTGTKPKKALVVVTDGEDRDSYYSLDEMLAKVRETDVQVYCVGFLGELPDKGLFGHWTKSEPEKAHDALQKISDETGCRAFFPKDIQEIHKIVSEIAFELRNQYSLSYNSSNQTRDGAYRRIRVALEGAGQQPLRVRYRTGYTAPKSASGK